MTTPNHDLLIPSRRSLLAGGLGLAAGGLLSACSSGSGSGSSGSSGGDSAFANKGMDYFFFVVQSEAIKRASEELNYTFKTTDANQDASAQYNNWNSALLQRPAWIIADPVDSEGLAPMTTKAEQQKIPVGIVDTPLTKGKADITVSFDNRRGGEMAAERTVELLQAKYGRPQGIVLNGYGALSSVAWRQRKEGFEDVLSQYPDIQVIARPTEGAETSARDIAASTLAEFPQLDAAHAPSDSITRGIVTSLRQAGRAVPAGQPGHVILTSIDGEPQSLAWAREGILDAEVSQDPVAYGEICVELLHQYAVAGKEISMAEYSNDKYFWGKAPITQSETGPTCTIPPYYIDTTNVDDPRQWGNVVTQQWGMEQK